LAGWLCDGQKQSIYPALEKFQRIKKPDNLPIGITDSNIHNLIFHI